MTDDEKAKKNKGLAKKYRTSRKHESPLQMCATNLWPKHESPLQGLNKHLKINTIEIIITNIPPK